MRRLGIFASLLGILLAVWACSPLRLHSAADTRRFYTAFYSAERGVVQFIKPLSLVSTDGECEVDLTFNAKGGEIDSVRVNLSISTRSLLRQTDSIVLSNGLTAWMLEQPKLLFTERNEEYFTARFTTLGDARKVRTLFEDSDWQIRVHSEPTHVTFRAPKRTQRRIMSIKHYLIDAL